METAINHLNTTAEKEFYKFLYWYVSLGGMLPEDLTPIFNKFKQS